MKLLTIASVALALTCATASAKTIRLATDGGFPPYNFLNDKGEPAGFEQELSKELCKRAKLDCQWVVNGWDSLIPNLVSGNYDAIMAAMGITSERQKLIDFSQAYAPATATIYAAKSKDIDLKKGTIAVQSGTVQVQYVVDSGATLLEFPNVDEAIAAVNAGEADAVMADKPYLLPQLAPAGLVVASDDIDIGGGLGIGMGIRKSDPELRSKFDAAIQSMKDDGSLNALILKTMGPNFPQF